MKTETFKVGDLVSHKSGAVGVVVKVFETFDKQDPMGTYEVISVRYDSVAIRFYGRGDRVVEQKEVGR